MPKIFIAKLLILFFFHRILFSQDVLIKPLSSNINSIGAEINFVKINDTLAYFTKISEENNMLKSQIYRTRFINETWHTPSLSKYNFFSRSTANIFFGSKKEVVLNVTDVTTNNYTLIYIDDYKDTSFVEVFKDSYNKNLNTQPIIVNHNKIKALYFVSDREGGFGGLDIWVSIIDERGNFGVPINAGSQINTSFDEITPFYNKYENKLYFSSNKDSGQGGFDIYKSEGELNLWGEPEGVKKLNSKQDEMYLTFFNSTSGYFSSNRAGAKFESMEFCCNDIFSFKYNQQDTPSTNLKSYLPINLYFHNDEPDCCTLSTKTNKTYKESYIDYFMMQSDYERYNKKAEIFFRDSLRNNYNKLNLFLEELLDEIQKDIYIEIQVKGYSSPLYNEIYNLNLSKRRISSLVNYLLEFKGGALKKHFDTKKIIITQIPFGESMSPAEINDKITEKQHSIYGLNAMLQRKIEIVNILFKK